MDFDDMSDKQFFHQQASANTLIGYIQKSILEKFIVSKFYLNKIDDSTVHKLKNKDSKPLYDGTLLLYWKRKMKVEIQEWEAKNKVAAFVDIVDYIYFEAQCKKETTIFDLITICFQNKTHSDIDFESVKL